MFQATGGIVRSAPSGFRTRSEPGLSNYVLVEGTAVGSLGGPRRSALPARRL